MSQHSEDLKAAIQWFLTVALGPTAKTIPLNALDALLERGENSADAIYSVRDRLPVTGAASEATLDGVRLALVAANAWLESLLDDQHGADLLMKLEAVRVLLAAAPATFLDDTPAPLGANAAGQGLTRSMAAATVARFSAVSDKSGTLHLEVSPTGAAWHRIRSVATAASGTLQVAEIEYRTAFPFVRWAYTNDATAQILFTVGTALVNRG